MKPMLIRGISLHFNVYMDVIPSTVKKKDAARSSETSVSTEDAVKTQNAQ
jgi:hypothetical protein